MPAWLPAWSATAALQPASMHACMCCCLAQARAGLRGAAVRAVRRGAVLHGRRRTAQPAGPAGGEGAPGQARQALDLPIIIYFNAMQIMDSRPTARFLAVVAVWPSVPPGHCPISPIVAQPVESTPNAARTPAARALPCTRHVQVSVSPAGPGNKAFGMLAGYIFGNNADKVGVPCGLLQHWKPAPAHVFLYWCGAVRVPCRAGPAKRMPVRA